jgi:DMSO reductase family type II enzyme molybdopterin subunit
MTGDITRRGFLKGTSAALALSLLHLRTGEAEEGSEAAGSVPPPAAEPTPYTGFEDVYRQRWTWDRIAKVTHVVNCFYQRGCSWNAYVKQGIVWREEQNATYPQTNDEVPDFNPRGCQKGACYSERMYDAGRLRYPLKRVGGRGAGRWKRASWDQALREIAEACVDAITTDGPGSIFFEQGTSFAGGAHAVGLYRTGFLLDAPVSDMNSECGDHMPGSWPTMGRMISSNSLDDLFYADLILNWGGNPVFTQIPNAHFIYEARYHGARVITIAPDYCASAIHADQWIPVNVGSDAALALAVAHVLIEEGTYDKRFVAEQTDMPFLVRTDTRRFLRQCDLQTGGNDDVFYVFDRITNEIREASKKTLDLGSVKPALEGEFQVVTEDGEVTVTPVFALLRRQLAPFSPEATAKITGVAPGVIRGLAREIARAKGVTVLANANFAKFYHGLEMERTQFLFMALAGQFGKKGSGRTSFPYLSIDSPGPISILPGSMPPSIGVRWLQLKAMPGALKKKWEGYTDEMLVMEEARAAYSTGSTPALGIFLHYHGGLGGLYGRSKEWDPFLKRELDDYLTEALDRGWQADPRKMRPRVLFQDGGNMLRRVRGYPKIIEKMLPKLDLFVTFDWHMSTTAMYSDYVLPTAGWYEKADITWAMTLAPFSTVTTPAVEPLGESKPDWEFHCLFLKEIQKLAVERGIRTFKDRSGKERRLDTVYDEFTFGGRFTEANTEELLDEVLAINTNLGGISWPELKEKGFERFTEVGLSLLNTGNATDIRPGETITANTWHTENKMPWPTLTRRMQFYIDHDFYMELGEELPIHKDNPPIGGQYCSVASP